MKKYFLKRIISTLFILFGVLLLTFILMYIVPGDPIQSFIGQRADEETVLNLKKAWGLDQPIPYQFVKYIGRVFQGDLGRSYFTQESVFHNLLERFPNTLLLAILAILIGSILGIPIGILSAMRQNSFLDKTMLSLTLVGTSLPVFWSGILVLMFATHLDTLPIINLLEPLAFNIILAAFVLGIRPAALLARITREQMVEILKEDYILSAWARGISKSRIMLVHALKNCFAPILTTLALDFGSLLSGAAITETIFGIPGIGKYALSGLGRRDYPVIMGMVLFSAFIFVMTNLIVDLVIPLFNPRLRQERTI
jgi:ABC-type dipeptide/oligopeptide/nickel transport system permease component